MYHVTMYTFKWTQPLTATCLTLEKLHATVNTCSYSPSTVELPVKLLYNTNMIRPARWNVHHVKGN